MNRTAQALGLQTGTVKTVVFRETKVTVKNQRVNKCGRKKKLDSFDYEVIRNKIHCLFRAKELFSVVKLKNSLSDTLNISVGLLYKALLKLGFRYKKSADCKQLLLESTDIINQRCNFLRKMREFREAGLHIVYLDETWVNAHHGRNY